MTINIIIVLYVDHLVISNNNNTLTSVALVCSYCPKAAFEGPSSSPRTGSAGRVPSWVALCYQPSLLNFDTSWVARLVTGWSLPFP